MARNRGPRRDRRARRGLMTRIGLRAGGPAGSAFAFLRSRGTGARGWMAASRVGRNPAAQFILRVIKEVNADDATHMAASVAYYAILSLFPLILGVSALAGLVANSPGQNQKVIEFFVTYLPGSEQFVTESVEGLVNVRGALGVLAIFGLLWTASGVFGALSRAVNRAWNIPERPFYKSKPRQMVMAAGIGLLFFISIALTTVSQWAASIQVAGQSLDDLLGGEGVTWLLRAPGFVISLGIFTAIYKFVPNRRIYWGDIWLGAVLGAMAFELAKSFFVFYLQRIANYDQVYGGIASVVVLMVWVYISALIVIVGAEAASEYEKMRRGLLRDAPPAA